MERKLPGARAQNELEIVDRERPIEFAVQTTSGPTPLVHRYRCDSEGATTVVHLAAEVELSGIAGAPVRSGREVELSGIAGAPVRSGRAW